MPYALVAFEGGLVAGLADGQLWGSEDRGESWERYELEGDPTTPSSTLVRARPARAPEGLSSAP